MKYQVGELVILKVGKEFSDNDGKLAIIIKCVEGFILPYKCVVQGNPSDTFFYSEQHMEKV